MNRYWIRTSLLTCMTALGSSGLMAMDKGEAEPALAPVAIQDLGETNLNFTRGTKMILDLEPTRVRLGEVEVPVEPTEEDQWTFVIPANHALGTVALEVIYEDFGISLTFKVVGGAPDPEGFELSFNQVSESPDGKGA